MRKITRPPKDPNLLEKIHEAVVSGLYRDTRHSLERANERRISLPEILEVLESGYHEKSKDIFRMDFQSWNYAIRGKTFDGDDLRIAIYLEENRVMIATVIRL